MVEKALKGWARAFAILAALGVVVMLWAIVADVGVRNITRGSLPGMVEIGETMVVVVIFLGMMQAGVSGEHITITLLTSRLSTKVRRTLQTFAWIVSAIILGWMTWATTLRAVSSFEGQESRFGILSWPIWPARIVIAVGIVSMLFAAIWNVVRLLRGRPPMGEAAHSIEAQIEHELRAAS